MNSATTEGETSSSSISAHPCRIFSLAKIKSATNNFDDEFVIGQGGFGKVYKGRISSEEAGKLVAIKRLDSMSDQGEVEFRAEIDMLSKLRHCNLVSLIGYCHENKEMILVYEFMQNGTLYHHLHKSDTPLSWLTRLKIAVGAARGLDYLHSGVGTQHGVIHRDVKSSNILLDDNWAARISDFGLSKIGPTNQSISFVEASVKGTFGYLDPEYFYTRKLTRKTDVYAFGVVLFELLSGRLPVDERNGDDCSLVRWAQKCVKERKLDKMVDFNIKGTSPKCLRRYAQLADRCVRSVLKERPTMTEVVASLQALLDLQDLQEKSSHSGESSGIFGFTWKFKMLSTSAIEPNSGQSGTSSPKSLKTENNKHQNDQELVTRYLKNLTENNCGNNINESGTSTPKCFGNNMNQYVELVTTDVKRFTYDDLELATRNIKGDAFLGEGSFGVVYKGCIGKLPTAIKKLDRYTLFDLTVLKDFCHPNLVKLIGYCLEGEQLYLVHEFTCKGNFEDLLCSGAIEQLSLVTKVKIVVGIARAITFLQNTWLGIGQSWLDRHMIMFDKDFTPKLSDCDVSYVVYGRHRYAYQDTDELQPELQCNLSGYEVVFLEVLTGKRLYNLNEVTRIDGLFKCGKESLLYIARLCFEICSDVDSESKMLTFLKDHAELLRKKIEKLVS